VATLVVFGGSTIVEPIVKSGFVDIGFVSISCVSADV